MKQAVFLAYGGGNILALNSTLGIFGTETRGHYAGMTKLPSFKERYLLLGALMLGIWHNQVRTSRVRD